MNKESINLNIIDGIYDIQPPVTSVQNDMDILLQVFITAILLAGIVFSIWKKYYSKKNNLKRKIKLLHTEFLQNRMTSHDLVFQLASLLQNGLQIKYINIHSELPEQVSEYKSEWESFSTMLSDFRYQDIKSNPVQVAELIQQSLFWIRIWP